MSITNLESDCQITIARGKEMFQNHIGKHRNGARVTALWVESKDDTQAYEFRHLVPSGWNHLG